MIPDDVVFLLLLLLALLKINCTDAFSPYRTAEQVEGHGLFAHGFGFGHSVTGPGFDSADYAGRLTEFPASRCRVPVTRLAAAASPPPFAPWLAGSGFSASFTNRGNCKSPKGFFRNGNNRRRITYSAAAAVLRPEMQKIIDPVLIDNIAKEAEGFQETRIPPGLLLNKDDPLFTQTKNKALFQEAFQEERIANGEVITSPMTKKPSSSASLPEPGFDLRKAVKFHWSAVARVLGLPPGVLDETIFRLALKEQRAADIHHGRATTPGIEPILNLPAGSIAKFLHTDAKREDAGAPYNPRILPKPPKPKPVQAFKIPHFDVSKLEPKEAFHWVFNAGRKPPLIFDGIIKNIPAKYFQAIQEPLRVFSTDHDDDAIPPTEHHFVQFDPRGLLSPTTVPQDDPEDTQEEEPERPRIPFPTTKWDKPTSSAILGVVGLMGACLALAVLIGASVGLSWIWTFDMPGLDDDESCPMDEDFCVLGKRSDAMAVIDCMRGSNVDPRCGRNSK